MRQKIGRVCMVLGALLILAAAALLAYNKWDASRADKASQEVLGELEQTLNAAIEEKAKSDTVALQPELDPTQEMTVTELNGWDYIGYLSIPSIGLELPVMSQWSSFSGTKTCTKRCSCSNITRKSTFFPPGRPSIRPNPSEKRCSRSASGWSFSTI